MPAQSSSKVKGNKAKGRQSAKDRSYYDNVQPLRSSANKNSRIRRAKRRLEHWHKLGVKKNGKPVTVKRKGIRVPVAKVAEFDAAKRENDERNRLWDSLKS